VPASGAGATGTAAPWGSSVSDSVQLEASEEVVKPCSQAERRVTPTTHRAAVAAAGTNRVVGHGGREETSKEAGGRGQGAGEG
jgi:hypothetical protein